MKAQASLRTPKGWSYFLLLAACHLAAPKKNHGVTMLVINFFKELHRRNAPFFYLGMALSALFLLFLVTFRSCENSLSEVCHWLKPCKFSASFAVYAFSLGWYLEYLKGIWGEKNIRRVTWLLLAIISIEIVLVIFQGWVTSVSYMDLHLSNAVTALFSRKLYILANAIIISDSVVILFITFQFFRKIALEPEAYLWSIRAGFVALILSSLLGAFVIAWYGQVPIDPTYYGLPFTRFTNRDNLISMHFLGIHYLQALPFCCYFFQKYLGKKFILSAMTIFVIGSLFFVFKAI